MRLGNWLSLRDVGELDEVKNLREAEETHVVSSRHGRIDTLEGTEGAGRAKAKPVLEEVHEGRARAQRQCGMASERGRSGEHRPWYWLKTGDKVRTLGWSKALKSGPTLSGSEAS